MKRDHLYAGFVILILAAYTAIYIDLPIYRPVIGLIVFCFLPGYFILMIISNIDDEHSAFILSICLSLAFLIGIGMVANEILFNTFKIPNPLETEYLAPVYAVVLFPLLLLAYNSTQKSLKIRPCKTKPKVWSVVILVSLSLIVMSYVATRHMTATLDNVPLIIVYLLYVSWICLIGVSRKVPSEIYPVALTLIGIGLIIPLSFRSNYIWGADIQREFWYMAQIEARSHWEILDTDSLLSGVLSANFLPVILNRLLGTKPMLIFKFIIPLLFSTSVIGVYALASSFFSNDQAYLAAVLYMATNGYLMVAQFLRTSLAIFFLLGVILTLIFIQDRTAKPLLLIVFCTAVVISHYTTSFILAIILFIYMSWVSIITYRTSQSQIPRVSVSLFALYGVLVLCWQVYISYGAIERGIGLVTGILTLVLGSNGTGEETRDTDAQSFLGSRIFELDIPHYIEFFVSWAIVSLIGIGLLFLLAQTLRKRSFTEPGEIVITGFGLAGVSLLGSYIFLPFVSSAYGLSRIVLLAFILVSPVFVVGCQFISDFFGREQLKTIIPIIIVALFLLSNAGVTYQMAGHDRGHTLVTEEGYYWEHVHDTDYNSADWLYHYKDSRDIRSDRGPFYNKLKMAEPAPSSGYISYLNGVTTLRQEEALEEDGYIYLHHANVVEQQIATGKYEYEEFDRYDDINDNRNRIYANGGSEIYDDS